MTDLHNGSAKEPATERERLQNTEHQLQEEIAHRRRLEDELQKANSRINHLLSASPVIIYSIQPQEEGPLSFITDNVRNCLGYTPEELREPGFWKDHVHPDDLPDILTLIPEMIATNQKSCAEYRFRHKDGSYRWMQDVGRVVPDENGKPGAFVGYWLDITERKKMELQIQELHQTLQRHIQNLQIAGKEQDIFTVSISHSLRPPLRNLVSNVRALERHVRPHLDDKGNENWQKICEAADDVCVFLEELAAFAHLSCQEMTKERIDLNQLVAQIRLELVAEAHDRNVNWQVAALPEVIGDKIMFKLVWTNLLANALKFTRPRSQPKIEIGLLRPGNSEAIFFVRDNGIGFDMQQAGHLFGLFQRLHNANGFEGIGIGLAYVRKIITRHGGRVWAEGAVNQGSTFYWTIPQER